MALGCLLTCWLQALCPTQRGYKVWDSAHPSSENCGWASSAVAPPSPGCCSGGWVCERYRPSWSQGLRNSGRLCWTPHSQPRCYCCWCCCFGLDRSNIQNRTGRCRRPKSRFLQLSGVLPSGCWTLLWRPPHSCPIRQSQLHCPHPSPAGAVAWAAVWEHWSRCWT